jgi:hypothetical protein
MAAKRVENTCSKGEISVLKKILLAASAVAAFAAPASAAVFTVTGGTPYSPLDAQNDFKTQLGGLGFDTLVDKATFTVDTSKGFNIYVVASESAYVNKFFVSSSVFTESDEGFDINRWAGIVADLAGIGFKANGAGSLIGQGATGFGIFTKGGVGYSANELYLGFDDGGIKDDNHDDFIIRISAVPEPATWLTMIAGFGLVGYQMRRRTSKVASAIA